MFFYEGGGEGGRAVCVADAFIFFFLAGSVSEPLQTHF